MKTIKTNHPEIGYRNNVEIIEKALREQFGFDDQSYMLTAIASHIWSAVCGQSQPTWGDKEIKTAMEQCLGRLQIMAGKMGWQMTGGILEYLCLDKGCAISYPHAKH